jgi:hypothetical protein
VWLSWEAIGNVVSTVGVVLPAFIALAGAWFLKQGFVSLWGLAPKDGAADGNRDETVVGQSRFSIPGDARGSPELSRHQFALLQQYHTQGLAQSKISFWFSLIFASLGFSVIMLGVGLFLSQDAPEQSYIASLQRPGFTLISGTVIDAVAALFFIQSNRARQLMTEFFDKLRVDRKLDEALKFANEITDPKIQSSLKAVLALSFAEVKSADEMLLSIPGTSSPPITSGLTVVPGGVEAATRSDGTKAAPAGQ